MSDIEWKVLKSNDDAERAQLNKILADIREKLYSSTGFSSGMTGANQTVTASINDQLNAMAEAWRNTTARINVMGDEVQVIGEDVLYLNSTVFDPETGLEATASALEVVRTEVDTLNDTVLAMYSLELDANGYIVGWKFTNDGSTGIADFRADRFRITAPGSMNSFEVRDGLIDSSSSTHSLYQGVNFGANSDLIMWYGPTPASQEDGATRANGLFSIGSNGLPHFGGTLEDERVAELPTIQDHEESLLRLGAKNADGTAFILNQDTVRVTPTESLGQRLSSIQSDFDDSNARIDSEETARADADSALASRIDVTEATMRGVATVVNPGFEDGDVGWASSTSGEGPLPDGVSIPNNAANAYSGSRYLLLTPNDGSGRAVFNRARFAAKPNEVIRMRMQTRTAGSTNAGAQIRLGIREWKADGTWTNRYAPYLTSPGGTWLYPDGVVEGSVTLSAEAAFAQPFIYSQDLTSGAIICDSVEVRSWL